MRSELRPLGIESFAVVLTGKVWIGSAGSETRREYMLIGEPLQLASQMLAFCTAEHPVLVDWPTSQANRSRFEFIERPMLVRVPGQLKQHAMLLSAPCVCDLLCDQRYFVVICVALFYRSYEKLILKSCFSPGFIRVFQPDVLFSGRRPPHIMQPH